MPRPAWAPAMTGDLGDLTYETCRHCHEGIKRRRTSDRPWVHTRSGRAYSEKIYDHHAEPSNPEGEPDDLPSPVTRARKGRYGRPPS